MAASLINLPYPVKGIDRSLPNATQPPLTCQDALNVRGFDPASRRTGGGKRGGFVRAFTDLAGLIEPRRVNGMVGLTRTSSVAASQGPVFRSVDDRMQWLYAQYSARLDAAGVYCGFRKKVTGVGASRVLAFTYWQTRQMFLDGAQNRLHLWSTSSTYAAGLAVAFRTTNQLTLTMLASGRSLDSAGSGSAGCTFFGPFVRASATLGDCIYAYLDHVGTNQVRLQIDKHVGGVRTSLYTSPTTHTLSGTTSAHDLVIGLQAFTNTVRATVFWGSEAIDETAEINNTDLNTNSRAGVLYTGTAVSAPPGLSTPEASLPNVRIIARLEYSREVPTPPTVINELNGGMKPPDTRRYVVPVNWTAAVRNTAAYVTSTNRIDSGVAPAPPPPEWSSDTDPAWPAIDSATANQYLAGGTTGIDPALSTSAATDTHTDAGATQQVVNMLLVTGGYTYIGKPRNGVEVTFRAIDSGSDAIGAVFRVSAAFRQMVRVRLERALYAGGAAQDQTHLSKIVIEEIQGNGNALGTVVSKVWNFGTTIDAEAPVFRTRAAVVRITDEEINGGANSVIRIYINENLVLSHQLSATAHAWGSYTCGADISAPTGSTSLANGFRVVNVAAAATPDLTTQGVGLTDVFVFSRSAIHYGLLGQKTLLQVNPNGVTSLEYKLVQAATLNRKVYAVDGYNSAIVQPDTTPSPNAYEALLWSSAVTAGTLPTSCKLICVYRGRIVLANQTATPSVWYMSRVNDPLDWDYGSSVSPSTKAYAGTNAAVGQPADAITALIPWNDDYLIFGGSSSLYRMTGDPGTNGAIDTVSNRTGVLGPRAWCFDDKGNLFFLGAGGLYVIPHGTMEPQLVTGKRLNDVWDAIDTEKILVQLAWDAKNQYVHIFLTPLDDSLGPVAGTHVVYDVTQDAPWLDQYPAAFGPTSVLEIDGPNPEDRRFLLGGWDGAIRRPDDSATSDDGQAIQTLLRFQPVEMALGSVQVMARQLNAFGSADSGPVTWSLLMGQSPAEISRAAISSARRTGTFFENGNYGAQDQVGLRERGPCMQLVLQQTSGSTRWGLERISVAIEPFGLRRR